MPAHRLVEAGDVGRWVQDPGADVLGSDKEALSAVRGAASLLVTFPRNWPSVYSSSESPALKTFISQQLKGKRCRAISPAEPGSEAAVAADASELSPLHSVVNAEQLAATLPKWAVASGMLRRSRTTAVSLLTCGSLLGAFV